MTAALPPRPTESHYRPDIDGLRAVAVLAVILFHFDVPYFSGGFVGVDVFFVISGYLITRLILDDCATGRFSFRGFYERRARRILPALTVVAATTTIAAVLLFMPAELEDFGESLAAMAVFASNIYFWTEVDYFDAPAILKPLLHTWSLAVEEQYYILYPLLLYGALKLIRPDRLVFILAALAAASFVWSVHQVENAPAAAFYLLPSRAWELLIGAAIAAAPVWTPPRAWAEALAVAGVGLIAYAVCAYDEATPFPGIATALPCFGAAALIVAGGNQDSVVVRLLRWSPIVWVGLLSYSLYLWHWPLYVMTRYVTIRDLSPAETVGVLGMTFALSALSWKFVEQPWRRRRAQQWRWTIPVAATSATLSLLAAGVVIFGTAGLPGRVPPEVTAVAEKGGYRHAFFHCSNRNIEQYEKHDVCVLGTPGQPPSFLVWGDSHADMYLPAIAAAAARAGQSGVAFTRGGCPFAIESRQARGQDERCPRMQAAVLSYLDAHPEIGSVVLAGFWRRVATGFSNDDREIFSVDAQSREASEVETLRVFERDLNRIVSRYPDRTLYFIEDSPEIGFSPPSLLARRIFMGGDRNLNALSIPWETYRSQSAQANQALSSVAERDNAAFVKVSDVLCPRTNADQMSDRGRTCPISVGGEIIYRNNDHLTPEGAKLLVDRFATMFTREGVRHRAEQ